jgi:hypothetical protein
MCAVWGSTWLVIQGGLATLPPLTSAGVRFVVAALVVTALTPLLRGREGGAAPRWWIWATMLGRLTQAAGAGPHGDPLPAVLDEVFLRVPAERKWDLLDLLHRLSERHQLVYLSDDPFVAAWASQRNSDEVSLLAPAPESV